MSLQDLVILSDKCEELESKIQSLEKQLERQEALVMHYKELLYNHKDMGGQIEKLEKQLELMQANQHFIEKEVTEKFEKQLEEANDCLAYYAEPENWTRSDSIKYDVIEHDDCADYPHFTRDIRESGGKRARAYLKKYSIEAMKGDV
jgi:chromosome segregation ATPase